jgi:hypothetical protein
VNRVVRAAVAATVLSLVGAVVGVVPAAAARPSLRICTANIQHTPDMPDWKVRADAKEVRSHCDLVLWQEIRERADHRALQADGWRVTPFGAGGVPVSWRTSKLAKDSAAHITKVSSPTPRCADGRPSYNPARYVGWVRLKVRATGQRVTPMSLHFPQRRTCRTADTQRKWQQAFHNTQQLLPRGALVVGGDWNRREAEIPDMTRQHWVTPAPRGLDHIFVARTGWRTVARIDVYLWSDHRLRGARVVTP